MLASHGRFDSLDETSNMHMRQAMMITMITLVKQKKGILQETDH